MGATSIVIHARRPEAANEVVELAHRLGCAAESADLEPAFGQQDLIISTLPSDVGSRWAAAVPPVHIAGTALLDASYHPWPTPLAAAWWSHAPTAPVASGRDMLLWQAVEQVRLMTGAVTGENEDAVVAAMRQALSTD
jgi:shikimate dehydrogenase